MLPPIASQNQPTQHLQEALESSYHEKIARGHEKLGSTLISHQNSTFSLTDGVDRYSSALAMVNSVDDYDMKENQLKLFDFTYKRGNMLEHIQQLEEQIQALTHLCQG